MMVSPLPPILESPESESPPYCSTCLGSDVQTLRDSDSDDAGHREQLDINAPPRPPTNRDREADCPARARSPSPPDAEVPRPWGPDDIREIFPWEHITGESRAWIHYVESSYGANFRWCRARGPSYDNHWRAMSDASPFKKGIFYDLTGPPLRPTHLGHTPASTVVVAGNPEWFVLPFFCNPGRSFSNYIEPYTTFDPRPMISRYRGDQTLEQLRLHTRNASVATMVYLCGQVRLADKQCQRCQRRRITTTMPGEAIPVCATAGRYYHGVCANCLAIGGTMNEILERCSVSNRLSYQDYDQLSRGSGDPGWVGRSPFIGDNPTDLAFARNLLWRKALPAVSRSSSGTATASSHNTAAEKNRDSAIAGSSNTAEVNSPVATSRRLSGARGGNRGGTATASSPGTATASGQNPRTGRNQGNAIASSSNTAVVSSPITAPRRLSGAGDGGQSTATTSSPAMAVVRGRNSGTPGSQVTEAATSGGTAVARTPDTEAGRSQNAGMARNSATLNSPNITTPGNRSTVIARRPSETG